MFIILYRKMQVFIMNNKVTSSNIYCDMYLMICEKSTMTYGRIWNLWCTKNSKLFFPKHQSTCLTTSTVFGLLGVEKKTIYFTDCDNNEISMSAESLDRISRFQNPQKNLQKHQENGSPKSQIRKLINANPSQNI